MSLNHTHPAVAPVLSTPDSHIFEDPTPQVNTAPRPPLDSEELHRRYEIERTVKEILEGYWRRIALQFEDSLLQDAVPVYQELKARLRDQSPLPASDITQELNLTILGDTAYGACCVDEIAAEHVDAEVVVHYGRACLSPTARLPVIYVFTTRPLDTTSLVTTFKDTYSDLGAKIILMSDVPYAAHQSGVLQQLKTCGYESIFSTDIVHNPSSPLPNRTTPGNEESLGEYHVFHIGQPATALLLTLSSRVASVHIYPCDSSSTPVEALSTSSTLTLRRRYALITSLSTVAVYGILINTLSVKNYLHVADHVKAQIAAAGKKSYTFVIGKVNAAKVANFSEIGGWVVIGCWESSLIESSEFYRPLITPFELQLALQADSERVWTGKWTSDFEAVLATTADMPTTEAPASKAEEHADGHYDSEEESAPPEFDLRTGRYVSHSRPMKTSGIAGKAAARDANDGQPAAGQGSQALVARHKGDLAQIGGVASPGAEFLRSQRTWQGLGSDFESRTEASVVEEGRSGVARGYVVGDDSERR